MRTVTSKLQGKTFILATYNRKKIEVCNDIPDGMTIESPGLLIMTILKTVQANCYKSISYNLISYLLLEYTLATSSMFTVSPSPPEA